MIGTGRIRCRGAGRGIEVDFGPPAGAGPNTFRRDLHPNLRADYVLANPPFNDSDWFRKDDEVHWQYGVPLARS
jgi:type I restriction enzyme M protein